MSIQQYRNAAPKQAMQLVKRDVPNDLEAYLRKARRRARFNRWTTGPESHLVGWLCKALSIHEATVVVPKEVHSEPASLDLVALAWRHFWRAKSRLILAACSRMDLFCRVGACVGCTGGAVHDSVASVAEVDSEGVCLSETGDIVAEIRDELGEPA